MSASDNQSQNVFKANPSIQKLKHQQFLGLGYGINAYFDLLSSFIKLFFVMSLINAVLLVIYHSYDGMKTLSGVSKTASYSIGNLGFSKSICTPVNFGVDNTILACPYGTVQKVFSFGI